MTTTRQEEGRHLGEGRRPKTTKTGIGYHNRPMLARIRRNAITALTLYADRSGFLYLKPLREARL